MQFMAGADRKDIRTTLPGGLGAINQRLFGTDEALPGAHAVERDDGSCGSAKE